MNGKFSFRTKVVCKIRTFFINKIIFLVRQNAISYTFPFFRRAVIKFARFQEGKQYPRLFYLKTLAGWERQKKFVVVKDNEG